MITAGAAGTEPYVINKRDRLRAATLAFVCFCALVLNCVGTGYFQITPMNVNQGYYITLWNIYQCVAGICGPRADVINYGGCDQLVRALKAAEAFVVMADVFLGFAFIFALLEYFAVVPRVIGVILAIIFVIFDIVAWAIVLGIYENSQCGATFSQGHQLDVGFQLLVAASVMVFLAIIFWFIRFCCWSGDCCTNKYTAQPVQFVPMGAPAPVAAPMVISAPMTYATATYGSQVVRTA